MMNFDKKIVVSAAVLAIVAIGLGAFGAHGLRDIMTAKALTAFETGVRYQMYHALALLVIGFAIEIPHKTRKWVYLFFISGIILFSGSIYLLAFSELSALDFSFLGPITPIGGLLLILGWLRLLYGVLKVKKV